jgi:phage tail-like protein
MAGPVRNFVTGNYFLELDGVKTGFLKSIEGGTATAEVVKEASGAAYFEKKHLGPLKYEDISMQLGFSMTKAVYDWIAACWQMNYQRKNGRIVACDFKMDAQSELQFFNALLTEVGVPAADGASKDPAYITLKMGPEYTRRQKSSGKPGSEFGKNEQKLWLPSNFRLTIDGLDCTKVNKVDAFTVKCTTKDEEIGDARDYLKEPGKVEFPNLKVQFSAISAQSWVDYHDDFVIKGNCWEDKEKSGELVFLSPNRQTELAAVKFFNLGIFKLSAAKLEGNSDNQARYDAELYCERMEFEYRGGTIG